MHFIRSTRATDASRIAEIIITNYRINFYPFFRNDPYYFGELNVMVMAAEYAEGSEAAFDIREFESFIAYLNTIVPDHIPQPYQKNEFLSIPCPN